MRNKQSSEASCMTILHGSDVEVSLNRSRLSCNCCTTTELHLWDATPQVQQPIINHEAPGVASLSIVRR